MSVKKKFLDYFASKNHLIIPSFSLIPLNDPSLLLINSGMAPMKKFFLGQAKPPSSRIANSQKCIRAGGKHNDLDDVGYTKRHHTFFEMLGNFSFGDYAHQEAIDMAWDFLTNNLNLPCEKLHITVHPSDKKSLEIWKKTPNVIHDNIVFEKENEWSAGEEGPCGVCTEIFYDHGGHIPGDITQGDRFVEIWNMVFMTDNVFNGVKTKLDKPCVDAGMGLERMEALCNGTNDNYEAPFFANMIKLISKNDIDNINNRIVADHSRSIVFMIDAGVSPDSEGVGYVLRKIIRRAIRRSINNNSIEICIDYIINNMSNDYPSLLKNREKIIKVFHDEKMQFLNVYNQGICKLNDYIDQGEIDEEKVFELYDTHGFPYDISFEIMKEKGISYDYDKFEKMTKKQKEFSKLKKYHVESKNRITEFVGYDCEKIESKILDIQKNDKTYILLDKTPFYVESGGQKSDSGIIETDSGVFEVEDMQKNDHEIWHIGKIIKGSIELGQTVTAKVDNIKRKGLKQHHTATHILMSILRKKFGNSVLQKGSSVKEDSLRLDFSMNDLIDQDSLKETTMEINRVIQDNIEISTNVTDYESAVKQGALITEKNYPNEVRVLKIGDISTELCCGTHVRSTGEIGLFAIKSHKSVASGIKRIEAICGMSAVNYYLYSEKQGKLSKSDDVENSAKSINRKEIKISNLNILIEQYSNANAKYLLGESDKYIKMHDLVILTNDKNAILVKVGDKIVKDAAEILRNIGGKGGGNKNLAQGKIEKINFNDIIDKFMSESEGMI
ncbi:alanine--tRNA ligase [Candidatus Cytomitobacter indipagum]|uniref:Alanine--tRNA ligase n=1 Tax=Candidatus Cytomitobacter indipagum TaxID=2601575 RepID=A0A5C0UFU1_9PROT|nr:alanine--tRNA ligase [Candidatus Cytomitobacter indipagum]QEK37914.1 alanine--tRNA ligase [Candidatus Cytomitobacter indipagum]